MDKKFLMHFALYSVTEKFWELVKDEKYLANPAKGSGHNRGLAVDLTIIDIKTKKELDMGSGLDNFSNTAHHDFNHPDPGVKTKQEAAEGYDEEVRV